MSAYCREFEGNIKFIEKYHNDRKKLFEILSVCVIISEAIDIRRIYI